MIKQHITKEQWNELSKEHAHKLSRYYIENVRGVYFTKDSMSPNIGHMIEFLGDNWYDNNYITFEGYPSNVSIILRADNLCDALWDAVKYKLKQ